MVFGFLKKKQKKSNNYRTLTIKEIVRETPEAISLVFEKPEDPILYSPGQFLTLIFNIEGKEERRSYSLSSSPYLDENPTVTIKRVVDGKVSNYIVDKLTTGDNIQILAPLGNFTVDCQSDQKRNLIAIAAGSGITPLMSIIKSVLVKEVDSKVLLIYGNRSEEHIIFKSQLDELEEKYGPRFKVFHSLTQGSSEWKGLSGRLNKDEILKIIINEGLDLPEYYLCGPTGFMEASEQALAELQVDKKFINKESFVSSINGSSSNSIIDQTVTIELKGSKYDVLVPAKKTILSAGLDQDLDMPFSCQSGLCSACRGKLIEGKVKMEEDEGLTEQEIKDGYILCCVSHPLTENVKVVVE